MCHILLLDGKRFNFQATRTSRVRDAFDATSNFLGLIDNAYFGLTRVIYSNDEFLDMNLRLFDLMSAGLMSLFFS